MLDFTKCLLPASPSVFRSDYNAIEQGSFTPASTRTAIHSFTTFDPWRCETGKHFDFFRQSHQFEIC